MLNIGILGCGKISQVRHIPEYIANENANLVGLFDLDSQRCEEIAAKYGVKAYASAQELLDDPAIDAVSVCVANFAHADLTIQALKAGKHVLCEKPMAITPGKNTWFFDKKRAAMGAMADLGIHKTDMLRYILGQDIVRTTARLLTLDKRGADDQLIGVDDNAICIYETSGGAFGTMTASWTYYGREDNSTTLYGTKGIMRIYDDPAHSIVVIPREGEVKYYDLEKIQTNDDQTASGVIDEFVEAIAQDRPSMLDATDVIKSMKAVFASIRSSEERRPVDVAL